MKRENQTGSFHMDLSERMVIELGLRQGKTFREIAWEINRDPTTVAKEVKRVVHAKDFLDDPVDCFYVRSCHRTDLCMGTDCTSFCKTCSAVLCTEVCSRRKPAHCERLLRPPYVCNGCEHARVCHLQKKYRELVQANQTLSSINGCLQEIEKTTAEIERNTAISAVANQQTAAATKWLEWNAWANRV